MCTQICETSNFPSFLHFVARNVSVCNTSDTYEITPVLQDGLPQTNREIEFFAAMMYLMLSP